MENTLPEEIANTYEGVMSIHECEVALKTMENNKTPGTDGLTPELYRYFWKLLSPFVVDSFNFAFRNGTLSISQRQAIISLYSEEEEKYRIFKKLETVSLLNVDYKIATKTIALRLERPNCQSGHVKGRFIGESIRLIADTMLLKKRRIFQGLPCF